MRVVTGSELAARMVEAMTSYAGAVRAALSPGRRVRSSRPSGSRRSPVRGRCPGRSGVPPPMILSSASSPRSERACAAVSAHEQHELPAGCTWLVDVVRPRAAGRASGDLPSRAAQCSPPRARMPLVQRRRSSLGVRSGDGKRGRGAGIRWAEGAERLIGVWVPSAVQSAVPGSPPMVMAPSGSR